MINCLCKISQRTNKKTLVQLISNFINVMGSNVNTKKLISFLYTSNEQLELEIKDTISIIIAPKINYLNINLTKYVQNLYVENYKTLTKETKDVNKLMQSLPLTNLHELQKLRSLQNLCFPYHPHSITTSYFSYLQNTFLIYLDFSFLFF